MGRDTVSLRRSLPTFRRCGGGTVPTQNKVGIYFFEMQEKTLHKDAFQKVTICIWNCLLDSRQQLLCESCVKLLKVKGKYLAVHTCSCDVHDQPLYVRSQNFEKRLSASSCLSVCSSAWNMSTLNGRIFMKIVTCFTKICREYSSFIKT